MNNQIKLVNITIIVLVSASLGFIYNFISPDGLPLLRQEIQIETVELTGNHINEDTSNALKGINLISAFTLFESKKAVFIDARDQWDFAEGHIPGAINIPEFSFEPDNEQVQKMDRAAMYVIYCDGDDCDVSKRLAQELSKLSFTNLYVYVGGFREWLENEKPVEASEPE